jgi:hypothetical protein
MIISNSYTTFGQGHEHAICVMKPAGHTLDLFHTNFYLPHCFCCLFAAGFRIHGVTICIGTWVKSLPVFYTPLHFFLTQRDFPHPKKYSLSLTQHIHT